MEGTKVMMTLMVMMMVATMAVGMVVMNRPSQVTAHHLNGEAALYVRVSSQDQVQNSLGSLEYQRGQIRHAQALGFGDNQIKPYEDLGLSGTNTANRPAFLEMQKGVEEGRITAVFASDQSRLARNEVEWALFLQLCKNRKILILIDGRILDLEDGGAGFSSTSAREARCCRESSAAADIRSDRLGLTTGKPTPTGPTRITIIVWARTRRVDPSVKSFRADHSTRLWLASSSHVFPDLRWRRSG
jgi:Resolvase, N terminal domain